MIRRLGIDLVVRFVCERSAADAVDSRLLKALRLTQALRTGPRESDQPDPYGYPADVNRLQTQVWFITNAKIRNDRQGRRLNHSES